MSVENAPIPDYLASTYQLLICGFPKGICEDEYFPLLALLILEGKMSHRSIARTLASLSGKSREEVYNDASGFERNTFVDIEKMEQIKPQLVACGFDEWLNEGS